MPLFPLLLIPLLAASVSADCYSHDGIKAQDSKYYKGPELESCGNGTNNCCLAGHKCGTNLLCVDGGGAVSRQYCANAAWEGCSDICPDGTAAGVSLRDCGNNIYCCASETEEACCSDERAFYVDPDTGDVRQTTEPADTKAPIWFAAHAILPSNVGTMVASSTFRLQTVKLESTMGFEGQTVEFASTTASSTPSSISVTQTVGSLSVILTSTSTSTPTSSSSPSPSGTATNLSPPHPSPKISAGAGAGIGIGVIIGVALGSVLIWFLLRRRKQKAPHGEVSDVFGYSNGAYPKEEINPPQTYYAHNGLQLHPTEMDAVQTEARELDGGVQGGVTRHELDSGAGRPAD